jgi:WD40 repeat protein/serine/threonine protein kinase
VKPATTITLESLLDLLRSANLLTAEQLARVEQHAGHDDFSEPGPLAWWLVEQNLVTRWQARMLMSGRKTFYFGKYKLLDLLGAGGMGSVYTAWQPGLARVVALKVMADKLLDNEQAVLRFHREIQSAAALEHPNIVATFDADCVGGKHFLVMEYMPGENLDALAKRRGRLPVSEACEYVRQAALGLAHAHERNMVHRDIKPANLLVGVLQEGAGATGPQSADQGAARPIVKILDFGLARLTTDAHGDTELTQTGQIMGTPDYIAPEQARDTKMADARSDIYSLGCTLFRLVTGQVPFIRQSVMEKLMARALDEAPRARSVCPDLPPAVDECIARMLAREPERRIQTAREVAAMLQSLSGATVAETALPVAAGSHAARPGERLEMLSAPDREMEQFLAVLADEAKGESSDSALIDTTRASVIGAADGGTLADARSAKRSTASRTPRRSTVTLQQKPAAFRSTPLLLAAVAALVVCAGGSILWYRSGETRLEIDWPESERKGARLELDGREPVLGPKLVFTGRPGKRRVVMTRKGYEPIEQEFALGRGAAVVFRPEWVPLRQTVRRRDFNLVKTEVDAVLTTAKGSARPAYGTQIAALRDRIEAFRVRWLTSPESNQAAALLRNLPAPADTLGTSLGFEQDLRLRGQLDRQSVSRGLVATIGDGRFRHPASVWSIAYSPDDSILAAQDVSGWLKLWNPMTGEELRSVKAHDEPAYGLAFSPDGRRIVTSSSDGLARIWETASLRELRTLRGYPSQIRCVAWAPQGNQVAAGGLDPSIVLWNPDDGKVIRKIDGLNGSSAALGYSPDASLLAVGFYEPVPALIIDAASGETRHELPGHTHQLTAATFSPDGKKLATVSYDTTLKIWEVQSGRQLASAHQEPAHGYTGVQFRPDGNSVVVALTAGVAEVRSALTGDLLNSFPCDQSGTQTIALAHGSPRLAAAGNAQCICISDLETATLLPTADPRITRIAVSPNGRQLALGTSAGTIDLWDIATRQVGATLRGHKLPVQALVFSPDGRQLVSGDVSANSVHFWDAADGALLNTLDALPGGVYDLAISPDGRSLATGGTDSKARLWSLETRGLLKEFDCSPPGAYSVSFNSTGSQLAVGLFGPGNVSAVKLFDVGTGREIKTVDMSIGNIPVVRFATDDKIIASGHPFGGVKLWDVPRLTERTFFTGSGSFAFSPAGGVVAVETASEVHLYNLAHGDRVAQFTPAHGEFPMTQLVFTPDGRHIAALGSDGNVYIHRIPAVE